MTPSTHAAQPTRKSPRQANSTGHPKLTTKMSITVGKTSWPLAVLNVLVCLQMFAHRIYQRPMPRWLQRLTLSCCPLLTGHGLFTTPLVMRTTLKHFSPRSTTLITLRTLPTGTPCNLPITTVSIQLPCPFSTTYQELSLRNQLRHPPPLRRSLHPVTLQPRIYYAQVIYRFRVTRTQHPSSIRFYTH